MELKDLSQAWKPFDELANPAFTSHSSRELYADAMSTLFNDGAPQEKAPTFFKEFLLTKKNEVREEFNKRGFAQSRR